MSVFSLAWIAALGGQCSSRVAVQACRRHVLADPGLGGLVGKGVDDVQKHLLAELLQLGQLGHLIGFGPHNTV